MSTRKKIVILGSGESGTGAAILAQKTGHQAFVSDRSPIKNEYKTQLEQHGIAYEENQHSLETILGASEIIKSPGIPEKVELMKQVRAAQIPVIGEIEFAFRYVGPCKIVAITGSNGKTTTTTLTQHLLESAGLNTRMGGNVGNSFAEMVVQDLESGKNTDPSRVFVLELSSFQLDDCQNFRADIAVLLNITPDHLDRYDYQLENYVRSKYRVTRNQGKDNLFIYNGFDPVMNEFSSRTRFRAKAKKLAIQPGFFQKGKLRVGRYRFDMTKTTLRGPHNMFNAVCAVRIALALGADPEKIRLGLQTYAPPPHRLEQVALKNGVTWINDSKATNVDSVFYALQAMDRPTVWIVGGQDKGNDYTPLFPWVREKVKAIVCMGLDNAKLLDTFGSFGLPMREAKSALEAVEQAAQLAITGDAVLLSPACASFDLFKNYEDRGRQFREAVRLRFTTYEAQ